MTEGEEDGENSEEEEGGEGEEEEEKEKEKGEEVEIEEEEEEGELLSWCISSWQRWKEFSLDDSLQPSHHENLQPTSRNRKFREWNQKSGEWTERWEEVEGGGGRWREGGDADVGCLLPRKHVNTVKNMATAREMTSPLAHSCDTEREREKERWRDGEMERWLPDQQINNNNIQEFTSSRYLLFPGDIIDLVFLNSSSSVLRVSGLLVIIVLLVILLLISKNKQTFAV